MNALRTDLTQAFRSIMRGRSVALLSLLCLGLGIGVVTTVFAVVNGVLLPPEPFRDSDRLLQVSEVARAGGDTVGAVSPRNFEVWRRQTFAAPLAAFRPLNITASRGTDADRVASLAVTGDLFPLLGVHAIAGRTFRPEEDAPGAEPVVMLGESLWRSTFAADPAAVGGRVSVNGRLAIVIGVVPRFDHPGLPGAWRSAQLWLPMALADAIAPEDDRTLTVIARAGEGTDRAAIAGTLEIAVQSVSSQDPANRDWVVRVRPVDLSVSAATQGILLTAMGAATFVLLIACANVANLLLLRSTTRHREMATRMACGASRARIVRLLFFESAMLGLFSAPIGLFLGWAGRNWLFGASLAQADTTMPIDLRVVAAAVAAALLTSVVCGLAPAMQVMRASMRDVLAAGGREATGSRSQHRWRLVFATSEVVLSLVLLVGASLLARSFANLVRVDRELDLSQILAISLGSPGDRRETPAETARAIDEMRARVESLASVAATAVSEFMPLRGGGPRLSVGAADGDPAAPDRFARRSAISAGFFETMGVALERGRSFTVAEQDAGLPLAVVNRRLADQLWPGEDAIGRRVRLGADQATAWYTVIGVSANISNWDIGGRPHPTAYVPLSDRPQDRRVLIVRAAGDPTVLISPLRGIVASVDRTPRGAEPTPLDAISRDAFFRQRTLALLFAVFSVLSILLTAVGLHGVLSCFVSQRRRELGIRAALGATRRDLIWLVGRQAFLMAGGGIVIGAGLALGLARLLQNMLFDVRTTDPISFNATAAFLLAVIALASWVPARRAASTDPARWLRD